MKSFKARILLRAFCLDKQDSNFNSRISTFAKSNYLLLNSIYSYVY